MRENLTETEAAVLMDEDVKRPSFGTALATFLSIVVILILGIFKFKVDMHVLLVLGMVVTSVVAKIVGFKWKEIEAAMGKGVFRAMIGMPPMAYTSLIELAAAIRPKMRGSSTTGVMKSAVETMARSSSMK